MRAHPGLPSNNFAKKSSVENLIGSLANLQTQKYLPFKLVSDNMANNLVVGLLLIIAGLFVFFGGVNLIGVSFATIVLPVVFFASGIWFVVLYYIQSRHKESKTQ